MSEDGGYSWHRPEPANEADSLRKLAEGTHPIEGRIVAILLCGLCTALLMVHLIDGSTRHWIETWGVSWSALNDGRYETIVLHMITHAGLIHLAFNATALWAIVPIVVGHVGGFPRNIFRFLVFFFLSGLAGVSAFLPFHIGSTTPMVGASGAICGLLGLLWRINPEDHRTLPLLSRRTWQLAKRFIADHFWPLVMFTLPAILSHREGGVAWEAHVGGLLFGLWAGPYFLEP